MADVGTINVRGLAEIEKRLQALPEKLRRKHINQAMQEGMDLVRDEAQRHIPSRKPNSGWEAFVYRGQTLRNSVATTVSVKQKSATGRVGLDIKKVHHGHLVEFGTKPHKIRIKTKAGRYRTIKHPGARKQPFMRPAFDNKGDQAVEIMTTRLARAVEKEI
jgi:HK97 gp10 family phage protein